MQSANQSEVGASGTLPADAARQEYVLGKDTDAFVIIGAQGGILHQRDEEGLGRLL